MHGGLSEHLSQPSQSVSFNAELQNAYPMEASDPLSMPIRRAAHTAFPIVDLSQALACPGLVNESSKRKIDGKPVRHRLTTDVTPPWTVELSGLVQF